MDVQMENMKKEQQKKVENLQQEMENSQSTQLKQKEYQIQQNNMQETIQQQLTLLSNNQPNYKSFTYQLIDQNSIKQQKMCFAIAINKDNSIVVAGYAEQIKVFLFQQGTLKQVQLLKEHTHAVGTLLFMKKSNHFISGSSDNTIVIWARNQNDQWIRQQKLTDHSDSVYGLILNNNEDFLFSCGYDSTIKFWEKQHKWQCTQTIKEYTRAVYGLSLNEQQNRVISFGYDPFILVIEQSEQNKKWLIIQKIQVESYGVNICFIDNNTFTFQPYSKEHMEVYEMNNTNKQYIKSKDIQEKGCQDYSKSFPQQYIKQKRILLNKNGANVIIMRRQQNGEFIIEQSIEFQPERIITGCMSDDGQYLITWDEATKIYQIREYKEI